jgi:hypothetical protein
MEIKKTFFPFISHFYVLLLILALHAIAIFRGKYSSGNESVIWIVWRVRIFREDYLVPNTHASSCYEMDNGVFIRLYRRNSMNEGESAHLIL